MSFLYNSILVLIRSHLQEALTDLNRNQSLLPSTSSPRLHPTISCVLSYHAFGQPQSATIVMAPLISASTVYKNLVLCCFAMKLGNPETLLLETPF